VTRFEQALWIVKGKMAKLDEAIAFGDKALIARLNAEVEKAAAVTHKEFQRRIRYLRDEFGDCTEEAFRAGVERVEQQERRDQELN
jgi:uncharacterized membrane protein YvbJ